MKSDKNVSNSVINRLPRYYRFLGTLLNKDVTRISSKELSQLMHVTASQIRQDLNCFGGFGQQGYGYNVELLHRELGSILGVNNMTPAIILGAGNLGKALINSIEFPRCGFQLVGIFEKNPAVIGQNYIGLTVQDIANLEKFCQTYHPKVAAICIPKDEAAALADTMVANGIVGFWNFSSYDFNFHHEGVKVVNVHLRDSLMTLSYMVTHMDEGNSKID